MASLFICFLVYMRNLKDDVVTVSIQDSVLGRRTQPGCWWWHFFRACAVDWSVPQQTSTSFKFARICELRAVLKSVRFYHGHGARAAQANVWMLQNIVCQNLETRDKRCSSLKIIRVLCGIADCLLWEKICNFLWEDEGIYLFGINGICADVFSQWHWMTNVMRKTARSTLNIPINICGYDLNIFFKKVKFWFSRHSKQGKNCDNYVQCLK